MVYQSAKAVSPDKGIIMESPTSEFDPLLVLVFFVGLGGLVIVFAKGRRHNCWDHAQVKTRLRLGSLGIVLAVAMLIIGFGLGFHLIFWVSLYQVALATYRKKDLALIATSQPKRPETSKMVFQDMMNQPHAAMVEHAPTRPKLFDEPSLTEFDENKSKEQKEALKAARARIEREVHKRIFGESPRSGLAEGLREIDRKTGMDLADSRVERETPAAKTTEPIASAKGTDHYPPTVISESMTNQPTSPIRNTVPSEPANKLIAKKKLISALALWFVMGLPGYAMYNGEAYCRHNPSGDDYRHQQDAGHAMLGIVAGPIYSAWAYFDTGFAEYGLKWSTDYESGYEGKCPNLIVP